MKKASERIEPVSEATSHRLSLLLRSLRGLEAAGVHTASSYEIAARFGLNSAQIRKDLAQFGEFGVRGVGYRVRELKAHLKALMGLDRTRALGIAGAGNLGQALADSRNFNADGFRVAALFDVDGRKIGGRSRTGVPIRDVATLEESVAELAHRDRDPRRPGRGRDPARRAHGGRRRRRAPEFRARHRSRRSRASS